MGLYVGDFISKIRQRTDNTDYSVDSNGNPTEGITQNLILDYLNEAQDFIQTAIISAGSTLFDPEAGNTQNTVANQEAYEISDNVHLSNKVRDVKYSYSGNERDFRNLPPVSSEQEFSRYANHPSGYIRRGRSILLRPIPTQATAKLRCFYPRQCDALDIRRGQITSSPGAAATSMTLDNDSYLDSASLSNAQYICTVDQFGEVQDYAIPITGYNSSTRVLSFASRTIAAVLGEFVVIGEYATSHLNYPLKLMEHYVKIETQMRVLDKDSSVDAIREQKTLQRLYASIMEAIEDESIDEGEFPYLDEFSLT